MADRNVTMRAKTRLTDTLPRSLIQGSVQVDQDTDTRPLCVQAETLYTDIQALITVMQGLEVSLPIQMLAPVDDNPDGLTANLAACRVSLEVLRGLVENTANRIGRL